MQMHKYSLQPAIELKTRPQIHFGKCSERKGCSKSSKIPRKSLQICLFFSNLGLQSTICDVRKNRLQEKCFLSVF